MLRYVFPLVLFVLMTNSLLAGTGYEVTAKDGDKTVTYMVKFGGARLFDQYTAFDPATKKFVYLTWNSRPLGGGKPEAPPKPVASIWNHATGETIELFKFPGAEHPLPVIPSIEAMKFCPITGDQHFQARPHIAYD
ncbi:hypothetical protein [Blastopirellula marina]|uniref:Uncharacterized protein n=1 Tax=Blastopirellula marina TaxID=124 RepID=A0A2S8FTT2_9BACT|nr:hypothetical protein [Blastopirellula marina]PQO35598.1 hypothetical protein C5Y98_13220 [Blastopirellula marina]PQO46798.1 hypothetical protein C5Y93_06495 [Blastopirellula marina]PTL44238.1 hypothetical protein C5Y97_13230 [Blastopirellula marina]